MDTRAAIVTALDALEAGDGRYAVAVLLDAFEAGPVVDLTGRRRRCPDCGYGPAWPGELDDHARVMHTPTGWTEAA